MTNKERFIVNRVDLFEQAWAIPISQLAKKYGVSDVGLAKICTRMNIPRPPRGYWAKLKVGKAQIKPQLPALSDSSLDRVTITPMPTDLRMKSVGEPLESIPFPEILIDPHPIVKRARTALNKGKRDDRGIVIPRDKGRIDIFVTRASIDRACRIMDALFKALEARGYSVTASDEEDHKTIVLIDNETLEIGIDEKIEHTVHVRTPADDARYRRTYQLPPRYDHTSTGLLSLRLRNAAYCGRQQWADGKRQKVEECLAAFIQGLTQAARHKKAQREEYEQRRREWELEDERRREHQRLEYLEKKRAEKLNADANAWYQAIRIRRYVTELYKLKAPIPGLMEWITWAKHYADGIDPLCSPNKLVFSENTSLTAMEFSSSDWP